MERKKLLKEEEKKMKRLRFLVDFAEALLMQSNMTLPESLDLIENTKKVALDLFPNKESVYDLIYTPRFRRIIYERFIIPGTSSGRN
jgi:hypothetical protein